MGCERWLAERVLEDRHRCPDRPRRRSLTWSQEVGLWAKVYRGERPFAVVEAKGGSAAPTAGRCNGTICGCEEVSWQMRAGKRSFAVGARQIGAAQKRAL